MCVPTDKRIEHLLEYTKHKETLSQASVKFRTINAVLRDKNKGGWCEIEPSVYGYNGEWRSINYKAKIYGEAEPITIHFRAYDDIDAVVQTLTFMERFDATGFKLERKKVWWRLVKETYPLCGLINAHHYDPMRPGFTNESKELKQILNHQINKQIKRDV